MPPSLFDRRRDGVVADLLLRPVGQKIVEPQTESARLVDPEKHPSCRVDVAYFAARRRRHHRIEDRLEDGVEARFRRVGRFLLRRITHDRKHFVVSGERKPRLIASCLVTFVENELEVLDLFFDEDLRECLDTLIGNAVGNDFAELFAESRLRSDKRWCAFLRVVAEHVAVAVESKNGVGNGVGESRDFGLTLETAQLRDVSFAGE